MTVSVLVIIVVRYLLVILFFPFSALDKILNFKGAVKQAQEIMPASVAPLLIFAGLGVEIIMPLCILSGVADRLAAFIMAGYCCVTAILWKQFWKPKDFWASGDSKGRTLFWDFLKNFALAGGFLILTFGIVAATVPSFFDAPFASSHPYGDVRP
jgi:putative oxidoreductase